MNVCACGAALELSADGVHCASCFDAWGSTWRMLPGEYVREVLRTYAGDYTLRDMLTLGALGLAGESGEVVDQVKKWLYSGHELDQGHFLEEMGDVLWYLTLMCSAFGWTLDDIMAANVEKLRRRYPDGFVRKRCE